MMLIDAKHFSGLNSGIISMRKNVGAIRKTLLKNRRLNIQLQTKQKQFTARVEENKKRQEEETKREQSRGGGGLNLSAGNFLKKPSLAFKGSSTLSDTLQKVVLFFSFALLGWMLNALPAIIKQVKIFVEKAQQFIRSLSDFWSAITRFFSSLWNGIEGLYKKLGFGGQAGLDETSEKKTRDMLADIASALGRFLKELPGLVWNLVKNLVLQHKKAKEIKEKNPDLTNEEAAKKAREELTGAKTGVTPTEPLVRRVNLDYLGKGKAMFGSTGRVSNQQGWVHGHFATDTGDINALVSDTANMIEALLQQGVPVELANGQGFTRDMTRKKIEELVRVGISLHTHSAQGRALDVFVPKGTMVPFPVNDLQRPTGKWNGSLTPGAPGSGYTRLGINAFIPGSGKTYVGHLDPTSGEGTNDGSPYVEPPPVRSREEITRSPGPRVVEINETVVVKLPPSISQERRNRYQEAFSRASNITIEVVSIDGEPSSSPLFSD